MGAFIEGECMADPISHQHLWSVCPKLPEDYTPYGQEERWADPDKSYADCSCGCKWYAMLAGNVGMDWGVCTNPASHRCGLLTFEHQGCLHFAADESDEGDV